MKNVMRKLPADFLIQRYGIECRLVQESDAEFIVNLRHNKQLCKHIHSVGNIDEQIEWIREYKLREKEGIEYYFIFSKNGEPFGLDRMYHIDWVRHSYTSGSWLCKPNMPFDLSLLTFAISDEIREQLGLWIIIYDVRKDNHHVLNFNRKILHTYEYGTTNKDVLFISSPETRKKSKLRKLLGLSPIEQIEQIPYSEHPFEY